MQDSREEGGWRGNHEGGGLGGSEVPMENMGVEDGVHWLGSGAPQDWERIGSGQGMGS